MCGSSSFSRRANEEREQISAGVVARFLESPIRPGVLGAIQSKLVDAPPHGLKLTDVDGLLGFV